MEEVLVLTVFGDDVENWEVAVGEIQGMIDKRLVERGVELGLKVELRSQVLFKREESSVVKGTRPNKSSVWKRRVLCLSKWKYHVQTLGLASYTICAVHGTRQARKDSQSSSLSLREPSTIGR